MKRLNRYDDHKADASERAKQAQKKLEQRFLRQQLAALDLSDRVYQILHEANIITIGDLAKKIEKDKKSLLDLEGFGPKGFEEAEAKLVEARETFFAEAK